MNVIVKSAVASALALGGTSAFAIGLPTSNSSDLILEVDAVTSTGSSAGVYLLDTGISLSSLLPGPYVSGASDSKAFSAAGATFLATNTLRNFISTNSSDTIEWTVLGGQVNGAFSSGAGATNSNTAPAGSAIGVFSSKSLSPVHASSSGAVNLESFINGLQADIVDGGFSTLTGKETASGYQSISNASKYNFIGGPDLSVAGSGAVPLFGFTGNNSGGTLQSYVLGTASLDAAGDLVISGNPSSTPVPLPAAVWLFGSGLLGLVGVSRRRKAAV